MPSDGGDSTGSVSCARSHVARSHCCSSPRLSSRHELGLPGLPVHRTHVWLRPTNRLTPGQSRGRVRGEGEGEHPRYPTNSQGMHAKVELLIAEADQPRSCSTLAGHVRCPAAGRCRCRSCSTHSWTHRPTPPEGFASRNSENQKVSFSLSRSGLVQGPRSASAFAILVNYSQCRSELVRGIHSKRSRQKREAHDRQRSPSLTARHQALGSNQTVHFIATTDVSHAASIQG